MPYHADAVQIEIVAALRAAGATVQLIEGANRQAGCPDLVVGFLGKNYLIEIKDPLRGKLSERQAEWHAEWLGQVAVAKTVDQAFEIIGVT